jgi:TatD DNase family protein
MVKYIDSHCHIPDNPMLLNVGAVYNATHPSDWSKIMGAVDVESDIYGCVGVHPWFVSDLPTGWAENLRDILINNPCLHIGEIGLDKFKPDLHTQISVFETQIRMACELERGVSLHCVGAWDKVLHILKTNQNKLPRFILSHGHTGSALDIPKMAEKYNMYFSYGLRDLQNVARLHATPLTRIIAETDSKNPNDVIMVVNHIAEILDVAPEKMADIIYANTIRMLKK